VLRFRTSYLYYAIRVLTCQDLVDVSLSSRFIWLYDGECNGIRVIVVGVIWWYDDGFDCEVVPSSFWNAKIHIVPGMVYPASVLNSVRLGLEHKDEPSIR
jgi:hypothetical protein